MCVSVKRTLAWIARVCECCCCCCTRTTCRQWWCWSLRRTLETFTHVLAREARAAAAAIMVPKTRADGKDSWKQHHGCSARHSSKCATAAAAALRVCISARYLLVRLCGTAVAHVLRVLVHTLCLYAFLSNSLSLWLWGLCGFAKTFVEYNLKHITHHCCKRERSEEFDTGRNVPGRWNVL